MLNISYSFWIWLNFPFFLYLTSRQFQEACFGGLYRLSGESISLVCSKDLCQHMSYLRIHSIQIIGLPIAAARSPLNISAILPSDMDEGGDKWYHETIAMSLCNRNGRCLPGRTGQWGDVIITSVSRISDGTRERRRRYEEEAKTDVPGGHCGAAGKAKSIAPSLISLQQE